MCLPPSKILKASKSLVAAASFKNNSPQQSVNIVVNSSSPDLLKRDDSDKQEQKEIKVSYGEEQEANPYKDIATRDLATAQETVEDVKKLIIEKDNMIIALGIIVDMYRHNPLIVNKLVVPHIDTLTELLRLLSGAKTVNIELGDVECQCVSAKYATVKRIYMEMNEGEVYTIEMAPAILQFMERYNIAVSMVQV